MLAKICSRRQKPTEFSDEFFAGVLRVKFLVYPVIIFFFSIICTGGPNGIELGVIIT